jgi:hypothetical protein
MIRANLDARHQCNIHPHRPATKYCQRCRRPLCDECKREYGELKALCDTCRSELEMADRMLLTPREKVLQGLVSLRNTIIVTVIFAGVFGGGFFLIRDNLDIELTPEELARFRYAMTGSFNTEEGVNATTTVLGASVVAATSERTDHDARRLIDEYDGPNFEGWRSLDVSFPQEIVVELTERMTPDKVILSNHPEEPVSSYVKDFEVLLSAEGPQGPWQSVGRWTAEQRPAIQRFSFESVPAKFAMLRVLSNYGSRDFTSLTSFEIYVTIEDPMRPISDEVESEASQ